MPHLQKPIRGVFLDIGWTMMMPPSGNWMYSRFARTYFPEEKLAALPQDRVNAAMNAGMEYLNQNHLVADTAVEHRLFLQYYTMVSDALPELGLTPADLKAVAEDKVFNPENYHFFDDTKETVKELSKKYKLGIISDTWPSIEPVLRDFGILDYFEAITYSFGLGVFKPHETMYRDALNKMGLPPGETVFVDDFVGNLQGAQKAGIQPVLIRAKPDSDTCADMVSISRISELPGVLE